MNKALTAVHPSIAHEMALLDDSVLMAQQAFDAITTGALPAKDCNVMISSARTLLTASSKRLSHRLAASRLAMQEAKLIEGVREPEQKAIPSKEAA